MRKQRIIFLLRAIMITVFSCFLAAAASARQVVPELQHIVVTGEGGALLLSASVDKAFGEQLMQRLRQGGELNFVLSFELRREKSGWFDETLRDSSFTQSLRYDQQSGEYIFTRPGEQERRSPSFREAGQWLTDFTRIPVIDLSSLVTDEPYAIRMRAVLKQGALPLAIGLLVPTWQSGSIATGWRTIEFRY